MLEDYLKIFNDYLEVHDMENAIKYIDKIFIDNEYMKIKNLFLYLLGCITELPEKDLDYIKTIFNYDLNMPVDNIDIIGVKQFRQAILYHYFIKARNIYYEFMDSTSSIECKRALLNLLNLASGAKKRDNQVIANLFKEKDYYNLYAYIHSLVINHPTFNNLYILDLLLHDYITKDYFIDDEMIEYLSLVEQVKSKNYEPVFKYYQNINYKEDENIEIDVILDVLYNIISEKEKMIPLTKTKKDRKDFDQEMFLDFLVSVDDVIEKEGFVILNPETEEINQRMRNLAFYIPNLSSYEIGDNKKQIVINRRINFSKDINDSLIELKRDAYNRGDSSNYIDYTLEHIKYIIPSELDVSKLAQSYFRIGYIQEGLNALNLAIGLKNYTKNNKSYTNNILNYYMMQDYFIRKKSKLLSKSRQR